MKIQKPKTKEEAILEMKKNLALQIKYFTFHYELNHRVHGRKQYNGWNPEFYWKAKALNAINNKLRLKFNICCIRKVVGTGYFKQKLPFPVE